MVFVRFFGGGGGQRTLEIGGSCSSLHACLVA